MEVTMYLLIDCNKLFYTSYIKINIWHFPQRVNERRQLERESLENWKKIISKTKRKKKEIKRIKGKENLTKKRKAKTRCY